MCMRTASELNGTSSVLMGRRPGGGVEMSEASRNPASAMCSVRGMGVALSVSTSRLLRRPLMVSLCLTPKRCSSSITSRPRLRNRGASESRACVPTCGDETRGGSQRAARECVRCGDRRRHCEGRGSAAVRLPPRHRAAPRCTAQHGARQRKRQGAAGADGWGSGGVGRRATSRRLPSSIPLLMLSRSAVEVKRVRNPTWVRVRVGWVGCG